MFSGNHSCGDHKSRKQVPEHIAIIPDGNRRWSRTNKLNLQIGYNAGIQKAVDLCIWAKQQGIKSLSLWALSTENIKNRSGRELNLLYNLYVKTAYDRVLLNKLRENQARVNVIGNMSMLPKRLKDALDYLQNQTKMYKELSINLLIGYGGRDDIMYAVKRLSSQHATRLNDNKVKAELRTASIPDIDLIIRTSGERRLSGFLPWQSDYSELYFARKYWPDFKKEDLKRAIDTYKRRNRRFGR